MSEIIKRVELTYRAKDGTLASTLTAVESFRGHTDDRYYVGAYIHTDDGDDGTFHLFEVCFLEVMVEIAEFKYDDYTTTTLNDLENTCRSYTDSTFTLDEAADNLSIFFHYLENGC